jgi:N-acetylornithine carbamoyltransferase
VLDDFDAGFRDADVVYPKSWGCMLTTPDLEESARIGGLHGLDRRRARLALARDDAMYLHCLPADRGVEVTDAVIDGPQQRGLRRGREPPARPEGRAGPDDVREPT